MCTWEGTGHLTALPSTDVTSQVLLFLQLLLLSDWCPLGKGWSVPALNGTYRLDWVREGRACGRHSPDPVRNVKKTREG